MSSMPAIHRIAVAVAAVAALATSACAPQAYVPYSAPTPVETTAAVEPQVTEPQPRDTVDPTPPASPSPTESPEPSVEPEPTFEEPAVSETPVVEVVEPALMKEGDDTDQVRELQHRLMQLEWFEGKIVSTYGPGTRNAVEGFQTKRGLTATGEVDQATWDVLLSMTRQPTHDEMHNILKPGPALMAQGAKGDEVKDLQARLKQLDWYLIKIDGVYGPKTVEAVKGFQGKREIPVTGEVDQRTKDRLFGMTRKPTTDELNNVAKDTSKATTMRLDDRCLTGRVVCISKKQRKLAWVIDGQVQSTMDVRFGSELTPTRNGVFSIGWKSRNHHSKLYDSPMPYALFFSGGQAVHYSSDFARRGYNGASHGCVNVRDKAKVAALFDATRTGDKVVVFTG